MGCNTSTGEEGGGGNPHIVVTHYSKCDVPLGGVEEAVALQLASGLRADTIMRDYGGHLSHGADSC